jgi:predicted ABC-type ATPase
MDITISQQSIAWAKNNRKMFVDKFCNLNEHPPSEKPITFFMAGSPGAGKTEFSKSIIPELQKRDPKSAIVRIDIDEVRELIPQYNGKNSSEIQPAANIGVERIFDFVQKHNQNAIVDSTFANYVKALDDVKRALNRKRGIAIYYLYLDPLIAWSFTKKREAIDGRNVPKEIFIEAFLKSKENVNLIKKQFGDKIEVYLIERSLEKGIERTQFNIENVDFYLKTRYTAELLQEIIK